MFNPVWLSTSFAAPEQYARPALAPAIAPNGSVSTESDTILGALGQRALAGDRDAQNALFAAFAPRLGHWVRRAQNRCRQYGVDPAIEDEDIAQQAFVVFADLLHSWDGRGSLSAFIIAFYPWRLSDSIRGMSDPRLSQSQVSFTPDGLVDGSYAADEANALLETLAGEMSPRDGQILLLRVRDRLDWTEIAEQIGVHKRTALRDWKRIMNMLRVSLGAVH
jgi:RNA polymerase sigma factor (sigma-70 family)